MKRPKKMLFITLASLTIHSCQNELELNETNTKNDIKTTEKVQVIEYKGLKVNHRFNTPIEELELNLDETGNRTMYTHIKRSKTLTPKINGGNTSETLLELPNEDIIVEATKEIVKLFPYSLEKEPLFERHEIHQVLDTLPTEVQTELLKDETITSLLEQEREDLKVHNEKVDEFHKNQEKRKMEMIHHDFEGLSDEQIENNIEVIDEYYKKNMNYEILKTYEEKKSELVSRAPKANTTAKTNYYPNNHACILWKSRTLANGLTIKNAGEDATRIANSNFPSSMSSSDTRKDAMRHIMWNVLLAKYYFTLSSKRSVRTGFAKRVTDAHEECGSNPVDSKQMDYHNNAIGRDIYWDNTRVKRNWLRIPYVSEASTATYTNDALNRIQNKSCYIVKKKLNDSYPEKLLSIDEKTLQDIRQKILQTDNETVVYIKGPIANDKNLTKVEDKYDSSACSGSGPFIETRYRVYRTNSWIFRRFFRRYYDSSTKTYRIPYTWTAPCVEKINVKCFRL